MIDDSYTWYQHEIDVQSYDSENVFLGKTDIDNILNNDFDSNNKYFYLKTDGPEELTKYKVWMILEDKSSSYISLFDEIIKGVYEGKKQELSAAGTDRISIYRYQLPSEKSPGRGMIIKADTKDFFSTNDIFYDLVEELNISKVDAKNSRAELKLSTQRDYKIMTYIACEALKQEGDLVFDGRFKMPLVDKRKKNNLENLCKRQDCSPYLYSEESLELVNSIEFSEKIVPLFYAVFGYQDIYTWTQNVEKLRILYKCVVEGQNQKLKSFLMREYVVLESAFRLRIDKYTDKDVMRKINGFDSMAKKIHGRLRTQYGADYKDVVSILEMLENRAFSSKITLGVMPSMINRLCKSLNKSDNPQADIVGKLSELSNIIDACSKNRNELMHGEIDSLFKVRQGNYLWVEYVTNFVRFKFCSEYALALLERILLSVAL